METEFKFRSPTEFTFLEPTEFKSWAPTADSYEEALGEVVALATFRDIAAPLQKQVDAGSLSDRAAMNELEGALISILYDSAPDAPHNPASRDTSGHQHETGRHPPGP